MAWSIEYYSDAVEQIVLTLPPGLLARYLRLTDLMLEFGANLGVPHTQAMGEGLSELRVRGKEGIAGVLQKTPPKELRLARRRLREVLSDDT